MGKEHQQGMGRCCRTKVSEKLPTFLDEQEAGAWQELWVSERGGLEGVVTLGGIKQTLSMCCPAGRESGNKHLTFSPAIHWLDGTSTCQIQ